MPPRTLGGWARKHVSLFIYIADGCHYDIVVVHCNAIYKQLLPKLVVNWFGQCCVVHCTLQCMFQGASGVFQGTSRVGSMSA